MAAFLVSKSPDSFFLFLQIHCDRLEASLSSNGYQWKKYLMKKGGQASWTEGKKTGYGYLLC